MLRLSGVVLYCTFMSLTETCATTTENHTVSQMYEQYSHMSHTVPHLSWENPKKSGVFI